MNIKVSIAAIMTVSKFKRNKITQCLISTFMIENKESKKIMPSKNHSKTYKS